MFSEAVVAWIIQETGKGRIQKIQLFLNFLNFFICYYHLSRYLSISCMLAGLSCYHFSRHLRIFCVLVAQDYGQSLWLGVEPCPNAWTFTHWTQNYHCFFQSRNAPILKIPPNSALLSKDGSPGKNAAKILLFNSSAVSWVKIKEIVLLK